MLAKNWEKLGVEGAVVAGWLVVIVELALGRVPVLLSSKIAATRAIIITMIAAANTLFLLDDVIPRRGLAETV